jgi:hypothetical protein
MPSAAPSPEPVAVIGGGPAGLMAAETIAKAGLRKTVFERMPTVARKLLIAGRGGRGSRPPGQGHSADADGHHRDGKGDLIRRQHLGRGLGRALHAAPPSGCVRGRRDARLGSPDRGYLLQACFVTGKAAGEGVVRSLRDR